MYVVPTPSEGKDGDVIASAGPVVVMDNVEDAVCDGLVLSATVAVKVEVPDEFGVPEIAPVD